MRITGLDEIVLHVTELDVSKRFFGEGLGLSLAPYAPAGRVVFALGGGPRLALEPASGRPPTSGLVLDFQVEDPAAFARETLARGLPSAAPRTVDGWTLIEYQSPDGVIVRARRPGSASASISQ